MKPSSIFQWPHFAEIGILIMMIAGISTPTSAREPDLILHHGKIVTVDKSFSVSQAIAIENDRIVQVGNDAEILKLAGALTQVLDLEGKTVLPGMIDSHVHSARACLTEFDHPIPTMETILDVLTYVSKRASALKEDDWIEVRQVFITRLQEKRYPT